MHAGCSRSASRVTPEATWLQSPHVQHCLVVRADSVHRIQETQAALGHALWDAIQQQLASASGHA